MREPGLLLAFVVAATACHRHDACDGGRIDQVWNDGARATVRAGLAGAAWTAQTVGALDAAATQWRASFHAVCESGEHRDARMHCLDRTLARFSALTGQLARLDGPGRIAAPGAVAELPQAQACETLATGSDVQPADAERALGEYQDLLRRLRDDLDGGDPAKVLASEPAAREAAIRAGISGAELDGVMDVARASVQTETGHAKEAQTALTRARDRALRAVGDKHPDLAVYDDALAAALRARGSLREALQRSNQGLALREAALGHDDRSIATSLLGRAQTEIEGGELGKAFDDLQHALAIRTKVFGAASPRLGEIYLAIAEACEAARTPAAWVLDIGDHAAIRAKALALAPQRVQPDPFAAVTQVTSDDDPAVAAAVGEKLLAAGDTQGATRVLKAAADRLGEEPTRTALRIYIALARASGEAQAARAAIAAYQAMPELERSASDEMWAISRR